jgi:protocatechuate 3,4-dioxygenase beta subunit
MRAALLSLLVLAAAAAQEQTGGIEGVVLDSVSHQPIKKAMVSINFNGVTRGDGLNQAPQTATTDQSGKFAFNSLPAGHYQITVMHQNYPQTRSGPVRKSVQVQAGDEATSVTVELVPGAAISGHIVDEDGDPLPGCAVEAHSAKDFSPTGRVPMNREDGSYRLHGIPPGKYTITAQCTGSVFQPRPLSEGPDPPPSAAYPTQFYPAASELKSAQIVELLPGSEKSGVDFQMRPVPVTRINGTLVAGSADWRGRDDLHVELLPLDPRGRRLTLNRAEQVNPKDGSFEIRQVFPGSYQLVAFSQDFSDAAVRPEAGNQIGGIMRVDVADKPLKISLQIHSAVNISGTIEIEHDNNTTNQITPREISIQLTPVNQFGFPPAPTQANEDGSFTLKSVLPGEWRIRLMAPAAFLKSAWLGTTDVTNRPLDLTSGAAAPLRIVVSTNTATIRGTGPAGQMVFSNRIDEDNPQQQGWNSTRIDSNGQFTLPSLAPGKYRIAVGDVGAGMPEEGGQELTVHEGETVTIEVKPETKPE